MLSKREMVLEILGAEFKPHEKIEYYLKDNKGEDIDLMICDKTTLYSDDQFKILDTKGTITLETVLSNQEVNAGFMNKLNKLIEKKNVLQTLLDLQMDIRIDIRTTQPIKDMLQKICEVEGRTMTKQIEQLIKEKYKKIE